jgi:hypothetical protein
VQTVPDVHGLIKNLQTDVAAQNLLDDPVYLLVVNVYLFNIDDLPRPANQLVERET